MVGKPGREGSLLALAALLAALFTPAVAGAAPLEAEQAERLRIQQHLALVEQQLREAPVDALTPAARRLRTRSLDELHRYWQAGVFPRNSGHPNQRRPYFIDAEGRPCAVGALIQRSGHEPLARRIDDAFHTEYVPNMPSAELLAWASVHGFSVAELALIQPSYCACGTGWDGEGGAAALEEAAAYRPVCGSNGLTYWNSCIAELCGGVTVAADGECEHEAPCELCGTGDRYVAVSECTQDAPEGICDVDHTLEVVPVSDQVAERWLEMQERDCQDPDYELPFYDEGQGWQPARPDASTPRWDCTTEAGGHSSGGASSTEPPASGGAGTGAPSQHGGGAEEPGVAGSSSPDAEDEPEPTGGCTCSAVPAGGWPGTTLALLALALLRRRVRHSDKT